VSTTVISQNGELNRSSIVESAVADCLVIGLPDERWGQRVCAMVESKVECWVELIDLQDHARGSLAGNKDHPIAPPGRACAASPNWNLMHIDRQPSGKAGQPWATQIATSATSTQA